MGWVDPDLLRDFRSEGTDSHRLCTIEDGWVERFGDDVLISFKRMFASERLLEELQTWADSVGFPVRRVFARFIPTKSERRESPALVVGDPGVLTHDGRLHDALAVDHRAQPPRPSGVDEGRRDRAAVERRIVHAV